MEVLLHVANVLYLFSYSVRDIMVLRLLTVVATACLMPYFFFRPEPLLAAIAWNILFTVINLYRIVLLYRERRPAYLDEREQALHDSAFSSLTNQQFAKLLRIASWRDAPVSQCLFENGRVIDELIALRAGVVDVRRNGELLEQRGEGDFLGESCLLTDQPIRARVVVNQAAEYATWPREGLKKLLADDPGLHASLQTSISRCLVRKLGG